MDFSQPFQALTSSLDGPVLRVLAGTSSAMTRTQIVGLVESASEAGVRKVLARLVEQGIVIEERIGSRFAYRGNREHILWPAIDLVANAQRALDARIREAIADWEVTPLSVEIFGSLAQGRSTKASDIDLIVVSPPLADDVQDTWDQQIDNLRDQVQSWTGNPCDIVVMSSSELAEARAEGEPALASKRVSVVGARIDDVNPDSSGSSINKVIEHIQAESGLEAFRRIQQAVALLSDSDAEYARRAKLFSDWLR